MTQHRHHALLTAEAVARVRWATLAVGLSVGVTALCAAIVLLPDALEYRRTNLGDGQFLEVVGLVAWVGNVAMALAAWSAVQLARRQPEVTRRPILLSVAVTSIVTLVVVDVLFVWADMRNDVPW